MFKLRPGSQLGKPAHIICIVWIYSQSTGGFHGRALQSLFFGKLAQVEEGKALHGAVADSGLCATSPM